MFNNESLLMHKHEEDGCGEREGERGREGGREGESYIANFQTQIKKV